MTNNVLSRSLEIAASRQFRIALFGESCAAGAGRHVTDLASNLAAAGRELHLLYSPAHIDSRFRTSLLDLTKFGGRSTPMRIRHKIHPSDIRAVMDVRRYLRRNGPFDIFHCHSTKAGFVGRLAALGLGIPIVYTPHAFLTMSPVSDPISFYGAHLIERTLSKTTDIFICGSQEERDHALSLGISPDRIRLVPNGISLNDARESKSLRPVVRRELGLSETDICVGTVMRLVDQKAPQVLVEAFGVAAPQLSQNIKLIIVGKGPLVPKLNAIAKRLRVQDRITFAGELPGLRTMSAFDIFTLSSCYEAHSYALIEALSLGLPIVTTAVGGATMSVQNGVNGFISPVGDVNAMASSLLKLARSSTLREQMSRASLKMANEFPLESMLRRMNQVYEGMLQTGVYQTQAARAGS